jgi:hypothetical protein
MQLGDEGSPTGGMTTWIHRWVQDYHVDVTVGDALPIFTGIKGFNGIFARNTATANHREIEPPDPVG